MTQDEIIEIAREARIHRDDSWRFEMLQEKNALEAFAKLVAEKEREAWKNAAIRLGEELSSVGPDGYYNMTAEQWLDRAMNQQPRGKNSLSPPQRTEQEMVMWPCLIDTADFSKGTITVVMQCEDYKVSAGPHWLSTTPPQRTEPIQSLQCFHCQVTIETLNDKVMHLLAQRTWVGLTDEEVKYEWDVWKASLPRYVGFAKGIEAKLRSKNQ